MGLFKVLVKVANPADPARFFEEYFLVDTAALHTFAPEDRLAEVGLTSLGSRELILAYGRRERRLLGSALLTLPELGETLPCLVIFAPKGSLYLLGATALENFGVEADPSTGKLKPVAAIVGGFTGSRTERPQSGADGALPLRGAAVRVKSSPS